MREVIVGDAAQIVMLVKMGAGFLTHGAAFGGGELHQFENASRQRRRIARAGSDAAAAFGDGIGFGADAEDGGQGGVHVFENFVGADAVAVEGFVVEDADAGVGVREELGDDFARNAGEEGGVVDLAIADAGAEFVFEGAAADEEELDWMRFENFGGVENDVERAGRDEGAGEHDDEFAGGARGGDGLGVFGGNFAGFFAGVGIRALRHVAKAIRREAALGHEFVGVGEGGGDEVGVAVAVGFGVADELNEGVAGIDVADFEERLRPEIAGFADENAIGAARDAGGGVVVDLVNGRGQNDIDAGADDRFFAGDRARDAGEKIADAAEAGALVTRRLQENPADAMLGGLEKGPGELGLGGVEMRVGGADDGDVVAGFGPEAGEVMCAIVGGELGGGGGVVDDQNLHGEVVAKGEGAANENMRGKIRLRFSFRSFKSF